MWYERTVAVSKSGLINTVASAREKEAQIEGERFNGFPTCKPLKRLNLMSIAQHWAKAAPLMKHVIATLEIRRYRALREGG